MDKVISRCLFMLSEIAVSICLWYIKCWLNCLWILLILFIQAVFILRRLQKLGLLYPAAFFFFLNLHSYVFFHCCRCELLLLHPNSTSAEHRKRVTKQRRWRSRWCDRQTDRLASSYGDKTIKRMLDRCILPTGELNSSELKSPWTKRCEENRTEPRLLRIFSPPQVEE